MTKFFLFGIMLLCSISLAHAQEMIETYDGQIIKTGDVLRAGYHTVTASHYITIREKITNEYGRIQYPDLKEDIALRKLTVTGFILPEKSEIFPNADPVVLARADGVDKTLYIDINRAVERGEIASRYVDHSGRTEKALTDELLLACCLRVNGLPVTDRVILGFVGLRDKELQRKCLADEFELRAARNKFGPELQKMMDEFDFSATYYIQAPMTADRYDFDRQAYPMGLFNTPNFTLAHMLPYGDYLFLVANRHNYRFLPATPEDAQRTNKRRMGTGTNGYIAPNVYGRVYLKLLDQKMEIPQERNPIVKVENMYRHRLVGARIEGLEVYDYPHCDYNLIGEITE